MKLLSWLRNKKIEYMKNKVELMNLKADYREARNRLIHQRLDIKSKSSDIRLKNIMLFEKINSNRKYVPFNTIPKLPRLRI